MGATFSRLGSKCRHVNSLLRFTDLRSACSKTIDLKRLAQLKGCKIISPISKSQDA